MTAKNLTISLAEAAALVQPGQTLALGGNMLYRRPVAFVAELLRQPAPPTDLTLLCFTAAYESDLLVGAGCVARTRTCYFGLEAFGFAPMFTQAAGAIQIIEETEASLALGLAQMRRELHAVTRLAGHGLLALRPDVKTITDPYTARRWSRFRPLPVTWR